MTYSVVDQNVAINLGAGINYTPATNVFAVADVGVQYNHQKYETLTTGGTPVYDENDYNNFFLPYFKLGLDADVFKWLDVRFGATSVWNRSSNELKNSFGTTSITTKDKFNYAENATYLGFGFHWNRLHVDTYTDPGMFLDGFNFLSGRENAMNFQLSAVYEMM